MIVVTIDEMLREKKEEAHKAKRHIFGQEYIDSFKKILNEKGAKGHRFLTLVYSNGVDDGGALLFQPAEKDVIYEYDVVFLDELEQAQDRKEFNTALKKYDMLISSVLFHPAITKPLFVNMKIKK